MKLSGDFESLLHMKTPVGTGNYWILMTLKLTDSLLLLAVGRMLFNNLCFLLFMTTAIVLSLFDFTLYISDLIYIYFLCKVKINILLLYYELKIYCCCSCFFCWHRTIRLVQIALSLQNLSDSEILSTCSTSPSAEGPDFVDNERRWAHLERKRSYIWFSIVFTHDFVFWTASYIWLYIAFALVTIWIWL